MPSLPHLHIWRQGWSRQILLPLPQRNHLQPELLHLRLVVQLWLLWGWNSLLNQRWYCQWTCCFSRRRWSIWRLRCSRTYWRICRSRRGSWWIRSPTSWICWIRLWWRSSSLWWIRCRWICRSRYWRSRNWRSRGATPILWRRNSRLWGSSHLWRWCCPPCWKWWNYRGCEIWT